MASEEESPFNSFNNDGSFLEQFRRLQEQKKQEKSDQNSSKSPPTMTTSGFMPATLSSKRVTKSGAVIMKLSGVKKKTAPPVKLKRPPAALRGDSDSEDEGVSTESTTKPSPLTSSSPAPVSLPIPATSPAATRMMKTSVGGSSFDGTPGPQAASLSSSSSSWTASASSGPSNFASVGGASNVGGASTSTVGPGASSSVDGSEQLAGRKRKRVSRWSNAPPSSEVAAAPSGKVSKQSVDDIAIAQAMASFQAPPTQADQRGMTEAQLQQLREQIELNRKVAEIQKAMRDAETKKNSKFEYDSDEDTEGGTWEHKARTKEMEKTKEKARELTEMNKGKHHIGDFLPPEELDKFVETVSAVKEDRTPDFSDYKDHKLTEENVGFKLLQKAGWTEGAGLGAKEDGITAPINKGKRSFDQSGVGATAPAEVKKEDDEFDLYRKRMMLAYRFRPNPLNNPRRPYY